MAEFFFLVDSLFYVVILAYTGVCWFGIAGIIILISEISRAINKKSTAKKDV